MDRQAEDHEEPALDPSGERASRRDRKDPNSGSDRWVAIAGFSLAAIAAFFPWYVFFNQESFAVQPLEIGEWPKRTSIQAPPVAPLAMPGPQRSSAPSPFDPVITATAVEKGDADAAAGASAQPAAQTFPGEPNYQLLHVANGRALIEDRSGMYLVRVGSILPDNSTLATMEERDGEWVIITSRGDVIAN